MGEKDPIEVRGEAPAGRVPDGRRTDEGQDLAEYAILIGLIALVVVGAVALFGDALVTMYDDIVATLPFS